MFTNVLFEDFAQNISKRLKKLSYYDIGEDSIRYDFFTALANTAKISPSDIWLEYPISEKSFDPIVNEKSKRKSKPKMDMVINTTPNKIAVEFGFFRRDFPEITSTGLTSSRMKIINDFIRLAVESFYSNYICYFICIADEVMMNKKFESVDFPVFPFEKFIFGKEKIYEFTEKSKEAKKKFASRFIERKDGFNIQIEINLIFNKKIEADNNPSILIWEVKGF